MFLNTDCLCQKKPLYLPAVPFPVCTPNLHNKADEKFSKNYAAHLVFNLTIEHPNFTNLNHFPACRQSWELFPKDYDGPLKISLWVKTNQLMCLWKGGRLGGGSRFVTALISVESMSVEQINLSRPTELPDSRSGLVSLHLPATVYTDEITAVGHIHEANSRRYEWQMAV